MAVLSDTDIKKFLKEKKLGIEGVKEEHIGPSNVDLCLGNEFKVFDNSRLTHIDLRKPIPDNLMKTILIEDEKDFVIHPGEFVLGVTREYVKLPADLMGRLDGRSSLGRLGLIVHSTAGIVHPGFEGQLVLEMANLSNLPIALYPGMKICQINFEKLSSPAENPYNKKAGSKYVGQRGTQTSKISQDSKK
ncbi:MAG: dCTP deaminase [Candidatus Diapherotrites archaeon]|nr:dCTP deaminase [Candidatus Diapherotrites archaeon]